MAAWGRIERRQALEQAHPAAPEEAHIGAYDEDPVYWDGFGGPLTPADPSA